VPSKSVSSPRSVMEVQMELERLWKWLNDRPNRILCPACYCPSVRTKISYYPGTRIVLILFWKIGLNDSNNLEQQNRTRVLSEHIGPYWTAPGRDRQLSWHTRHETHQIGRVKLALRDIIEQFSFETLYDGHTIPFVSCHAVRGRRFAAYRWVGPMRMTSREFQTLWASCTNSMSSNYP